MFKRLKAFKPDYLAKTVFDIDYEDLWAQGIRVLAFDIDNTLGLIGCTILDQKTLTLLLRLHRHEFRICFATNSGRDCSPMGRPFEGKVVQPGSGVPKKPHLGFFRHVAAVMKADPANIAFIGDKLLWDTSPANQVGMVTVLVNPLGKDLLTEKLVGRRLRENMHLRKLGIRRAP